MHVDCYDTYTQQHWTCPICLKSLGDMTRYYERIDALMGTETMPAEFRDHKALITCNDCARRSVAPNAHGVR